MAKLVSARLFRHYALGLPASDSLAEFLSVTLHIAGSVFLVASALPGLTSLAHLAGRGVNLSLLAAVCFIASTGWDVLASLAAHTLSYTQLPAAVKVGWDDGGRVGGGGGGCRGDGGGDSPGGACRPEPPALAGRTHRSGEYAGVGGASTRSSPGGPLSASGHPPHPTRGQALCDGIVALGTFASAVARLNAALLLWLAGDGASTASTAGRRHGVWAAGLGVASMLVGLPLAVSPWEAGWGGAPPPPGGWARAHRIAVGVSAILIAASVAELVVRLRLNEAIETATAVAAAAATSLGSADATQVTVDPTLLGADATLSWLLLASYAILLVGAVANQVRVGDLPTVDAWWAASATTATGGGGSGGGGGRSRDVEAWGGSGGSGGDAKVARHAASDASREGGRGGSSANHSTEARWASGRGGGGGGRDGHDLPGRRARSGRERDGGGRGDAAAIESHDVDAYVGGGGGGEEKLLRSKKYRRERRR
ncbi:hypothetical protein I4F81_005098 [Pyropia yezoensis]|uniref:Uncharacterized protein n=1 Tax=Pyropia yezoensis TaxID=2788 RepID=A0ACC3BX59_PYRYE|nr:hypothetical protein I4F81_005098 [Neopyropia yezoensis]